MKYSEYIPVTAAVIEKEGMVLIARKPFPFKNPYWEFPGGKAEEGETLEECLKREIREELGIEIKVGECLCAEKHIVDHSKAITLYAFRAEYVNGDVFLSDHEEIRWVKPENLLQYKFPRPDLHIVRKLMSIPCKITV